MVWNHLHECISPRVCLQSRRRHDAKLRTSSSNSRPPALSTEKELVNFARKLRAETSEKDAEPRLQAAARTLQLVIYTITERVRNFQHLQSSNDAASVHSIVHAHVPRGLLGSLRVWASDACGRRSCEQFSDFSILNHLHRLKFPPRLFTRRGGN